MAEPSAKLGCFVGDKFSIIFILFLVNILLYRECSAQCSKST